MGPPKMTYLWEEHGDHGCLVATCTRRGLAAEALADIPEETLDYEDEVTVDVGEDLDLKRHASEDSHDCRPKRMRLNSRMRRLSIGKQSISVTSGEVKAASSKEAALARKYRDVGWIFRVAFLAFTIGASVGYALYVVTQSYPTAISVLGFAIFLARGCAMGVMLCTGLLFLSASQATVSAFRYYVERWPKVVIILDARKEIHMFIGRAILVFALVHSLCHLASTVPHMMAASLEELNDMMGCARHGVLFSSLMGPECPLKAVPTFWDILASVPVITGLLLAALLTLGGLMARKSVRRSCFSWFRITHQFMAACWPVLLLLHGSNNWLGLGVPLMLPFVVCLLPYWLDVLFRWRRRMGHAELVGVMVRDGPGGSAKGSLIRLDFRKPSGWRWRNSRAGMYARMCVPEISQEWHDFTICSCSRKDTVSFMIEAVGDFTTKLVEVVGKDAPRVGRGVKPLPPPRRIRICLDGPISAPFEAGTTYPVVAAVGAGVGVTPLLSMMESLSTSIETAATLHDGPAPNEAHFFWCTRNVDDFRFAAPLLTRVTESRALCEVITEHLHLTKLPDAKTPEAILWREGVRRWNKAAQQKIPDHEWPSCWRAGVDMVVAFTGTIPGGIPIVLGRPNFEQEIRGLGKQNPAVDIHVFVCGNKAMVQSLKSVCDVCSNRDSQEQHYIVHHERFG